VFQFSCTDLNTADTLTYSIIQSTYSQNFVIVNHSPTGDLLTNWVFDYYTMPQTTFTIRECSFEFISVLNWGGAGGGGIFGAGTVNE
jgi:hypothetical protein